MDFFLFYLGAYMEINISIKVAENGCIVNVYKYEKENSSPCGCNSMGGSSEKSYVYDSLEEALDEIPSIVNVTKEEHKDEHPKMSEKDIDEEEKSVNKKLKKGGY